MKSKKILGSFIVSAMIVTSLSGCGKGDLSNVKNGNASVDAKLNGENASATEAPFDIDSKDTKKKTNEIEGLIEDYFYFDEEPSKQEEKYYDGILDGLDDPYSVYYTKEEYDKLMEDDSGEYCGIGATVSKKVDTGLTYVVKPIKNSPAEAAGVLPGDVFISVDDTEITTDMELEQVVKMIRGTKGTTAKIRFYRESIKDYVTIEIKRDTVQNYTVDYSMLDDKIGYIKIDQFIDNTPKQFYEAVDSLTKDGAKSIIFDLRDNPGGLVSAVTAMADYIIDDDAKAKGAEKKGLLLSTQDKNGNDVTKPVYCSDGHKVDLPMVVLVNGNSASAAEIFTGVLRDYGVATVVGENTYGKGIMQSVFPLKDGSAVKLTIAKYFIPSGEDIHKKGIAPDVEVVLDESLKYVADKPIDKDNQLQKGIEILGGKPVKASASDAGEKKK